MTACRVQNLAVSVTDRYLWSTPGLPKNRARSTSVADVMVTAQLPARMRQSSVGSLAPEFIAVPEQASVPTLREVKKFMKRFPHLSKLVWVDRDKVRSWQAIRCSTAKDFSPVYSSIDLDEAHPDASNPLHHLQAPECATLLSALDLDIDKRIGLTAPDIAPESSLPASITSSSIATSFSKSSEDTSYSSATTVTDGPSSPKLRLSPVNRSHKVRQSPTCPKEVPWSIPGRDKPAASKSTQSQNSLGSASHSISPVKRAPLYQPGPEKIQKPNRNEKKMLNDR